LAQVGLVQRLDDHVEPQLARRHLRDGQATPVDRDALAVPHVGPGVLQCEPPELGARDHADDGEGALDDAGEHGGMIFDDAGTVWRMSRRLMFQT
jgi:hypothetical protein